ncbi:MAG: ShlB/FhaC/HecB family hemolysin secretion/activation protein [Elainellaceae cyanobacterium]
MVIGLLAQVAPLPPIPPPAAPAPLTAQVAEPPSTQPLPEPDLSPLPPPDELLPPPESENAPELVPELPEQIFVERFVVEGNTVIDDEALAEVLSPFTGRSLSFAELLQARTAVTQRYVEAGYITSGAFIPPQTMSEDVVVIQVLEGQIAAIDVEVDGRLNSGYVRRRLQRAATPVLNADDLLAALQLLQVDPLIDTISAELLAGVQPGTSLLNVEVVEADTFDITLQTDNGRSPSVGSFRRGVTVSQGNVLGLGDGISVSYANTDGSDAVDLSYRIPLNAAGGTFTTDIGFTESEIIEDPFNFLDIQSESRFYEFTYRQPIVQTPAREFALSVTASRRESESEFLDALPFPTLGADEEGRTRVSALRFAQEWTQQGSRQVIAARSQFSLGLDAFDATVNDAGPDARFFAWRGQAQWVRLLEEDLLLLVRGDVQLADNSLVPLERFGLGGSRTVRGYRQDELLTDSGVLLSSEVRLPVLRVRQVDGLLQVVPFVDVGHGWNLAAPDPDPAVLASVGLGLLWQMGDRLNARVDFGFPLVDTDSEGSSLQEDGVHFNINLRLF